MHKFAFCWGSALAHPVGRALTPDSDLLTVFTAGAYYQGHGGKGEGRRRGERKEKGKEGRRDERRDLAHPKISAWRPLW